MSKQEWYIPVQYYRWCRTSFVWQKPTYPSLIGFVIGHQLWRLTCSPPDCHLKFQGIYDIMHGQDLQLLHMPFVIAKAIRGPRGVLILASFNARHKPTHFVAFFFIIIDLMYDTSMSRLKCTFFALSYMYHVHWLSNTIFFFPCMRSRSSQQTVAWQGYNRGSAFQSFKHWLFAVYFPKCRRKRAYRRVWHLGGIL